jgi:hypothetical protein
MSQGLLLTLKKISNPINHKSKPQKPVYVGQIVGSLQLVFVTVPKVAMVSREIPVAKK